MIIMSICKIIATLTVEISIEINKKKKKIKTRYVMTNRQIIYKY